MSKRVRISNDSLNSYGSRVLTSGMSVEQYCRNPVLLYMHQRGNVIGYVKDLRVEDGEVTGVGYLFVDICLGAAYIGDDAVRSDQRL